MGYLSMHSRLIRTAFLALLIGVLLCGCDVYAGKRPPDYRNSTWICEKPYIELHVDESGYTLCIIGSGEDRREYDVFFTPGDKLFLSVKDSKSSEDFVFKGECSFGREIMTVRVHAAEDQLFYGEYETLVFVRQ